MSKREAEHSVIAVVLFAMAMTSTTWFGLVGLGTYLGAGPRGDESFWIQFCAAATITLSSLGWSIFLIGKKSSVGWAMIGADCAFVLLIGIAATPTIGKVFFRL
jgi:hypothetical protein